MIFLDALIRRYSEKQNILRRITQGKVCRRNVQAASGLHFCCGQVCIFLPLPVLQKAVFRTLKDRLLHCRWRPLRGVSAVLFVREAYSFNHYMPPFAQKQAINGMLMYNWNSLVFSISPLFADIFRMTLCHASPCRCCHFAFQWKWSAYARNTVADAADKRLTQNQSLDLILISCFRQSDFFCFCWKM